MNKNSVIWVLVAIIVVVLIYVGVSKKSTSNQNDNIVATTTTDDMTASTTTGAPTKPATTPTVTTIKPGVVKKFATVLAAVSSGTSVRCSNPTGTVNATYFIARGKVRQERVNISGTTYLVATPQALFSWIKGSTKETDYYGNVAVMERNSLMNTSLVNVTCLTANIPDSYFARP